MNVAMLCCHVRSEMRVGDVMLQNILKWLHGCCVSFVLGGSLGTKPCVFPCKVAPAGDEKYLVCVRRLRLRSCWRESVPPLCSAMNAASYAHTYFAFVESLVADLSGMAA